MTTIKTMLLFASLMMLGLVGNAQDRQYIPLINPNNTWSIAEDGTAGGFLVSSFYLKTDDTITMMKGREYHKIFLTYDTIGIEDEWDIVGYISEDTDSEQCYFMNLNSDDGLIYDFSAEIGDTLQLWNSYQGNIPVEAVIQEKDTVLIGNSYRKRLITENIPGGIEETWIEGIGSLNGLLFSNWEIVGFHYSLLCFFESNELVYHNEFYDTCYYGLMNNIEEIVNLPELKIFPNPIKIEQTLNIIIPDNDYPEINILSLYTLNGILEGIWQFRGNKFSFNLPALKKGLYFIELNSQKMCYHKKIQIN